MCGISGEIVFKGFPDFNSIEDMGKSLQHRGRDGQFHYHEKNISVYFNWLAIRDKHAPPPFYQEEWIVWMNGEIYNHLELRKELKFIFDSKSDIETVAVGIQQEGLSFIKKLNGIFIIVAYNIESESLHIARDRFGAKQLYYNYSADKFIFSSEPKAFLKHKDYSFDINKNAVGQWLTYQNYFGNEILFDKIYQIESGKIYTIDKKGFMHTEKYFQYEFSDEEIKPEEIYNTIHTAFQLQ